MEAGFWANQFENPANAEAHDRGTGPELWQQTGGRLDAFICACGTGGTLGGTSAFLKERAPTVQAWVADPEGSALYSWVTTGALESRGSTFVEGIGIKRITANFARARVDGALQVTDEETIEMVYYLLRREGLFVGGSAALNCVAAVKLARKLGRGSVVATVLCDGGSLYHSRLFSADWLAERGLVIRARELEFISDA